MTARSKDELLKMQVGEATERLIYAELAKALKRGKNRDVLERIAADESAHYLALKKITGMEIAPDRLKFWKYTLLARFFGLSFGLRLMEKGEEGAQEKYTALLHEYPPLKKLLVDEEKHEQELLALLSDENLEYASEIVLGLNDAIVEFSGSIAGFTFALGSARIIAVTGFVMGVAASLSMGASSYLAAKEQGGKNPVKSFAYTAAAYMLTVSLMLSPYLLVKSVYEALACLLAITLAIIAAYSFYITTARGEKFLPKFLEIAAISFGVAVVSFLIGVALKDFAG